MSKPFSPTVSAVVPACPQLSPTGQERTGQERRGLRPLYPHVPSLPSTLSEPRATNRLRDLENATVADAELIHDCRWMAAAARRRIANRRDEIERLRTVVLAGMEAA